MDPLPWWRLFVPLTVFALLALAGWRLPLPRVRIVLRGSLVLIGYAVLQDQVTAQVCPEYFTVGHPPVVGLTSPAGLGLVWGFLGGFGGGIVLGLVAMLAATAGRWPRLTPRQLAGPLLRVPLIMLAGTLIAGLSAWYNAGVADITIGPAWAVLVPVSRQRAFFVVACAHFGTYLGGALGAALLCVQVIDRRRVAT